MGSLGIRHVKRLWSRCMAQRFGQTKPDEQADEWVSDGTLIYGLGLGLHETLQYLYLEAPAFERFEQWILEKNGGRIDAGRIDRINAALDGTLNPAEAEMGEPVLTPEDLAFWEKNGYVVLHDAVSPENCAAAAHAIYDFLGMDLEDPRTWYRGPQGHSIWIPLLHHPAFWANRNSPRIHSAFAQLWGRGDLWVTVDQGGMNPPETSSWRFPGPHLHWDTSLEPPMPFGVQGILYLTDTEAQQGAFTCVPGFHLKLDEWLKSLNGADPRQQNLQALGPVPIAGKAGDLIIWHHGLPHGSSPNRSARPRVVQYLSMRPTRWDHNVRWK